MSIRIPLPKLLDSQGNEMRRIQVVDVNLTEKIMPLSTATMTIRADEEDVPERSFVELFTVNGSAGVYRTKTPESGSENTNSVSLEHAICEVGDFLVREKADSAEKTLAAALQHYFGYYGGTRWQLGAISATGNVVVSSDYQDILSAMLGAIKQVSNAMMAFDFSTRPWTILVRNRDTVVSAEGRISRNVNKARIRMDDSKLCTRAWLEGLGQDGAMGFMDADTIGVYGVVEKPLTGNGYTQAQAQTVAAAHLAKYKRPIYSIQIDGEELSAETGESLDRIELGKLYRLTIPRKGITIEETVISRQWRSVYNLPRSVTITLAEEEATAVTFLRQKSEDSKAATDSLRSSMESGYNSLDEKIDDTQEDVDWVWQKTGIDSLGEDETLMTRIQINAEGIQTEVTRASTAEGQLSSRITQNADSITAEVTRATTAEGTLSSRITQTAESITAEVTRATAAEGTLSSRITQTAESITAEVTRATEAEGTLSSRITQTAESIQSEVTRATEAEGTLSSRITQNADAITLEVQRATTAEGEKYDIVSGISITSDGITISGSKYLTLTSGGSFTVNSGNFSVNDQGELRASKLITVAEDGTETVVNMKNWPFWKLNYATVKSISTSGGTLTIVTTAGSYSFDGAATVTLSGSWSGSTFTVDASNGASRSETFSAGTGTGNQTSGGQHTIDTFNTSHKAYGYVNASSLSGSRLYTFNVDATSEYTAGYDSAKIGHSWDGATVTFTKGTSGANSVGVTLSAGASISYDSSTHKYTATGSAIAERATRATETATSGTEAYDAGVSSGKTTGYNSAKVTHSWDGATVTFSKSTSGADSVGLTLSASASISYNSSTHKYTATGSAIAERATRATDTAVSDTEAYDAGYTAGYNKGYSDGTKYGWGVGHTAGWQAYYDSGWWSKPNANSNVCKIPNRSATGSETWFTVTATHSGISWSNPAQYYIRATDTAYATIDNVNVASVYIYDSHKFKSDGGIN